MFVARQDRLGRHVVVADDGSCFDSCQAVVSCCQVDTVMLKTCSDPGVCELEVRAEGRVEEVFKIGIDDVSSVVDLWSVFFTVASSSSALCILFGRGEGLEI